MGLSVGRVSDGCKTGGPLPLVAKPAVRVGQLQPRVSCAPTCYAGARARAAWKTDSFDNRHRVAHQRPQRVSVRLPARQSRRISGTSISAAIRSSTSILPGNSSQGARSSRTSSFWAEMALATARRRSCVASCYSNAFSAGLLHPPPLAGQRGPREHPGIGRKRTLSRMSGRGGKRSLPSLAAELTICARQRRYAMLDRRTVVVGLAAAAIGGERARAAAPHPVTPQEMLGPFYPAHPMDEQDFDLTQIHGHRKRAHGEVIEIIGRVLRPDGSAVRGAVIEVWQANAAGKYRHPNDVNPAPLDPNFQGYARLLSGRDGGFRLLTVKPGAYPAPIGMRTPHVHFAIQSKEFRLATQMYFPGEPLNVTDPLLSTMAARHLNPLLVMAERETARSTETRFRWDVVLMS
jgi:protocatechuate 3,4-dioxygenase beta subunit